MSAGTPARRRAETHPLAPAPGPLDPLVVDELIESALREDLGRRGDLTTDAIVDRAKKGRAGIVARQAGRVAGLDVAIRVFRRVEAGLEVELRAKDGDDVAAGATLVVFEGPLRGLLTAERTALNLLGRMCGIATATRDLAARLDGTAARLCDTRKTSPGLRSLEKYAVRCGGGLNHRSGLHDAILIKDNHVSVAGSVSAAIQLVRAASVGVPVEVEVDTLAQLDEALDAGAEVLLLDNFSVEELRTAVRRVGGRALLEASGGIGPETVAQVGRTGVDFVSSGWITHSAPALDVALDVTPAPERVPGP